MPLKAKSAASNSSEVSKKPAANGSAQANTDTSNASSGHLTRPDKKAYDTEQERIKKEIEALQQKLTAVRDKIGLATKGGAGNEKRNTLRAELESLRGQQSSNKSARGKVLDQIKDLNDKIQKRIKDLQASKSKVPFKSLAEIDAHIKSLESRVESGTMKLAEEKRALQEISQCKRNRRLVETFEAEQKAIDADKAQVEELRKELDDPEFKALSDRYDTIKEELDQIKKEEDELYANRNKLFAERDTLQEQVNTLWSNKRELTAQYREAGDRYWARVNEERARKAERARAQRAADEAAKKKEVAERLLEEAQIPAFQAQIEDCQTLIDYFSGKNTAIPALKTAPAEDAKAIAGVEKLDIRKVEDTIDSNMVLRKKKGEDEEAYFVGGKGKKNKKGGKPSPAAVTESAPAKDKDNLNVPLSTLSALLSLSIPPPTSSSDLPRVVEDLGTKKAWFEANQTRVTAENVAKAEAEIKRLSQGKGDVESPSVSADDVTGANGGGEKPAEPAPTPSATDAPVVAVPSEVVDEKLEAVQEDQ